MDFIRHMLHTTIRLSLPACGTALLIFPAINLPIYLPLSKIQTCQNAGFDSNPAFRQSHAISCFCPSYATWLQQAGLKARYSIEHLREIDACAMHNFAIFSLIFTYGKNASQKQLTTSTLFPLHLQEKFVPSQ